MCDCADPALNILTNKLHEFSLIPCCFGCLLQAAPPRAATRGQRRRLRLQHELSTLLVNKSVPREREPLNNTRAPSHIHTCM